MSARHWRVAAAAALLFTASAPESRAGLYRCERPDGSVVFTDSRATCPGARPHEPHADVQSVDVTQPTRRSLPASAQRSRAVDPSTETMAEAQWRDLKRQLERELEQVTYQTSELEPHIRTCNRGGYLFITQDNGLKKQVPCESLRKTHAELEERRVSLHEYLEHGLSDECRRAGCLPGWLR